MVELQRQRVLWTGFPGGPGISTFYFTDAALHQGALKTFMDGMAIALPGNTTVQLETGGDTIESTTGLLTGGWTGTAQAGATGGWTGGYSPPSGCMVTWFTSGITGGRRLKGRTFFVPLADNNYQSDGTIMASFRTAVTASANTLIAAHPANMKVFQRPRAAQVAYTDGKGHTHKAITARVGGFDAVVSGAASVKVVTLRSRRD